MNIIIVTILLPYPLNSGGTQAQFNMIDVLRKEHNITIIFPENKHNCNSAQKELKNIWPEVSFRSYSYRRQLCNVRFFTQKAIRAFNLYFRSHSTQFQIERILKPYGYILSSDFIGFVQKVIAESNPNIVQIEFYPYMQLIKYLKSDKYKNIFVHHEIRFIRNDRELKSYALNQKQKSISETIKKTEIENLNNYDSIITLTNIDKKILSDNGVTVPIHVSPAAINSPIIKYQEWKHKLIFIGGHNHGPNVEGMQWLSNEILPLIDWSNEFKNVTLHVIGSGWSSKQISGIPEQNLNICGFVKDITNITYGGILLVPILSGSGMRMKILEGMALGLPIITTSVGVEGIGLINDTSCLIADEPENFVNAIVKLMKDENLRKKLATNALKYYITYYSKEALSKIRNNIYEII